MRLILMAAALLVGCGTDEPAAPTCATAVPAYYEAGCEYLSGTGRSVPEPEMLELCRGVETDRAAQGVCGAEFEAWLTCWETASAGGCDCAAEVEAVIRC